MFSTMLAKIMRFIRSFKYYTQKQKELSLRSILFVCLGNICRSPLADGIANRYAGELGLDIYIDSAGTSDWHKGEAPCEHSIKVAKLNGVDISALRSRPICPQDLKEFELVVAMDRQNRSDLLSYGFENVKLLGDFGGLGGADVPDPYHFKGFSGFEKVYEMIDRGVRDILRSS